MVNMMIIVTVIQHDDNDSDTVKSIVEEQYTHHPDVGVFFSRKALLIAHGGTSFPRLLRSEHTPTILSCLTLGL